MRNPPRVKICGITCPEDAVTAAEAGADAIGLVFYDPSPRNVASLSLAAEIAAVVPPFVSVVGLFVNPEPSKLLSVLEQVPLSLIQFHGDEDSTFCEQFKRPYLKALRMKPGIQVDEQSRAYPYATGILLDAYRPGVPGGTGEVFDWDKIPRNPVKPIVLAGGLTPVNVVQAVQQVAPWAVDVSGGVESAPGVKSQDKIRQFIACAKQAFN